MWIFVSSHSLPTFPPSLTTANMWPTCMDLPILAILYKRNNTLPGLCGWLLLLTAFLMSILVETCMSTSFLLFSNNVLLWWFANDLVIHLIATRLNSSLGVTLICPGMEVYHTKSIESRLTFTIYIGSFYLKLVLAIIILFLGIQGLNTHCVLYLPAILALEKTNPSVSHYWDHD